MRFRESSPCVQVVKQCRRLAGADEIVGVPEDLQSGVGSVRVGPAVIGAVAAARRSWQGVSGTTEVSQTSHLALFIGIVQRQSIEQFLR